MSHSVLLYEVTRRPFDLEEVASAFEALATGSVRRTDVVSALAVEYGDEDATLEVRLDRDREAIWIEGFGPTAMAAAVRLRAAFGRDVMLADEGYEFDLLLDGSRTAGELLDLAVETMRG